MKSVGSQPHRYIFEDQEFYGHNSFFQITTTLVIHHFTNSASANSTFILLQQSTTPLSEVEAVDLVKDTFASAAERDIYTVTPTQLEAPVNLMFLNK
jgi:20S proteasome subunit beta 6